MTTKTYLKKYGNYAKEFLKNAERTKGCRVVRFFPRSDLRCSQIGLRAMALSNGIDPWEFVPGEFIVFSNTQRTMLKVFGPSNILVSLKHPLGHKIDLDIVRYIPKFFNGGEFDYESAMKKMLTEKLAA